jgi:hypothetical protein
MSALALSLTESDDRRLVHCTRLRVVDTLFRDCSRWIAPHVRWRVGLRWCAVALLPAGLAVAAMMLNVMLGAQAAVVEYRDDPVIHLCRSRSPAVCVSTDYGIP